MYLLIDKMFDIYINVEKLSWKLQNYSFDRQLKITNLKIQISGTFDTKFKIKKPHDSGSTQH